ncbi:MAG: non-homologous end-joining DNA ligase [Myxococcota bacterium]
MEVPEEARDDGVERIAGVRLTSPDKVLFPEQGLTKRDLVEHYRTVEGWILPHVAHRPLTVVRCPEGHDEHCFYQKHATSSVPSAVGRVRIQEKRKKATYMHVSTFAGLVGLVQMGVLEIHVWGSRRDRVERPDRMVFDLDPGEGTEIPALVEAARVLRGRLEDLGLTSFVMATGGKGLHVVLPVTRRHDFQEVKEFTKTVAKSVEEEDPDRYVAEASKHKRRGRVFIDYLRNTRGATAVCPYSTRARPGAPVAVPLRWDELTDDLDPAGHTVERLHRRLARMRTDPWQGYADVHQSITSDARRRLGLQ